MFTTNYSDKSLRKSLGKDNSVSIHHENIHALAIETFRVKNLVIFLWKGQTISTICVIILIL